MSLSRIMVFGIPLGILIVPIGLHIQSVTGRTIVRPIHTYSIIAIDPDRNEMGFAVQSHWFNVGSVVGWAESGVGVVATQSLVDISYGPLGLALMRGGKSANAALQALLNTDDGRDVRQVAMLDTQGNIAAHTGKRCIPEAGHIIGEFFSVQANLMEKNSVWPAMAKAFQKTTGDLAKRMLAALEAAENEGGDIRGRQSAALKVVRIQPEGPSWRNILVDLRVDDHLQPLIELRRLLNVHRAYDEMNAGDLALEKNNFAEAMKHYKEGARLLPDNLEPRFWQAVGLVQAGHAEEALPIFSEIFQIDRKWWILLQRLPGVNLFPSDKNLWNKLHKMFDNPSQNGR